MSDEKPLVDPFVHIIALDRYYKTIFSPNIHCVYLQNIRRQVDQFYLRSKTLHCRQKLRYLLTAA